MGLLCPPLSDVKASPGSISGDGFDDWEQFGWVWVAEGKKTRGLEWAFPDGSEQSRAR